MLEESILESWEKALEVLATYGGYNPVIIRLTAALHLLFDTVPKQDSRFKQGQRNTAEMGIIAHAQDQTPGALQALHGGQSITPNRSNSSVANTRPMTTVENAQLSQNEEFFSDVYPYSFNMGDSSRDLMGFDPQFDPNDLSWLMTVPLEN